MTDIMQWQVRLDGVCASQGKDGLDSLRMNEKPDTGLDECKSKGKMVRESQDE